MKKNTVLSNALDILDERLIDQALDYAPGRLDQWSRHRAAIAAALLTAVVAGAALAVFLKPTAPANAPDTTK